MGLKQDVIDIKKEVKRLNANLEYDINQFKVMKNYLEKVHINVDDVTVTFNDKSANYGVDVRYSVPPIHLQLDDDGNVIQNEKFTAINMLNLISYKDMEVLKAKIEEAKEKNGSNSKT